MKIAVTTGKGEIFILQDTDLWGIDCALMFCIMNGYYKDSPQNLEWAKNMRSTIDKMRGLK